jgi:hypothetical protein
MGMTEEEIYQLTEEPKVEERINQIITQYCNGDEELLKKYRKGAAIMFFDVASGSNIFDALRHHFDDDLRLEINNYLAAAGWKTKAETDSAIELINKKYELT